MALLILSIIFSLFFITVPLVRLHRIYDNYNFIATGSDVDLAISKYGFIWQSVSGSVAKSASDCGNELKSIHRMYKAGTNGKDDHLFTYSESEVNLAVNTVGYRYEGIRFYCGSNANDFNATLPLHRYWTGARHFYTTNADEGDDVVAAGGKYEGILCYIWQ